MKRIYVLAALFGGLFAGCGGDSADCSSACDKVFNQCNLSSFHTPGGTAYEDNCPSLCEEGMKRENATAQKMVDCIVASSCSELSSCE
jgi:hypothetical protein